MYKAGLILEGGGMRGVYTAGVLDVFLENEIEFSTVYGVSAGSCQAASYLSKQKGRGMHTLVDYVDDPEYCGIKSLLTTGNMFGVDMCYSRIPDVLYPYDYDTFSKYEGRFYAVLTNVETGEAEYHRVKDMEKQIWAIRASSSLPLISKTIVVQGRSYLDGGIADSIPIKRSMERGQKKNVVILTRDKSYRKAANPLMAAIKLRYGRYPAFVKKMEDRHLRYNETLEFLEKEEKEGNVFVIRPQYPVEVDRLEKNKNKLMALYEQGVSDAKDAMDNLKIYLES